MGAQFTFEGKHYTKTSPILAAAADGTQRVIARSAILQPLLESSHNSDVSIGSEGNTERILQAFSEYEHNVLQLLQQPHYLAPEHLSSIQQAMSALGQIFRSQLKSK